MGRGVSSLVAAMTVEDLTPRCERCRHWDKVDDREHGRCCHVGAGYGTFTLPADFCKSYTPEEVTT
jgi:hypothetical protein